MEKKPYEEPVLEIVLFETEDNLNESNNPDLDELETLENGAGWVT